MPILCLLLFLWQIIYLFFFTEIQVVILVKNIFFLFIIIFSLIILLGEGVLILLGKEIAKIMGNVL